jgi:hypothetical protein
MRLRSLNFKSVQEALDFLASISQRAGAGELELQSANDVSNLVRNWIMGVTAQDELQLKIAKENPQGPQEIHIVGGLPPMPGTAILPGDSQLNGNHVINGHKTIDHEPATDSRGLPRCCRNGVAEITCWKAGAALTNAIDC